jgi:hypothetical protein
MGITPQQFFSKNMKWFALAFFILFLFKSMQSCNRNMGTRISEKEYRHTIDSLTKKHDILIDSIKRLQFTIKQTEIELGAANERVEYANKRADAVTEVAKRNNVINMQFENVSDSLRIKR